MLNTSYPFAVPIDAAVIYKSPRLRDQVYEVLWHEMGGLILALRDYCLETLGVRT
jgi:hypothetical protein